MKKFIAVAALGLSLALSACAPNGSTTTAPEPAPTSATSTAAPTPTPTPTVRVAERIVFEGTAAYTDLAVVAERGDTPVILLPAVLGASVTITGAPAKPWTESFLGVYFADDGIVTIRPQEKYDAFATPKDFVGESSGTLGFEEFSVEIEGVQP